MKERTQKKMAKFPQWWWSILCTKFIYNTILKKKEDYNKKFIKTKWKQMDDVDNDDAIITKTILNNNNNNNKK